MTKKEREELPRREPADPPTPTDPDRWYQPAQPGQRASTLSRERIRQVEQKALRKVRAELAKRGLTFDDLLG